MTIRYPRSSDEVSAIADVAAAAFGADALNERWRSTYAWIQQVFGFEVFLALEIDGRFVSSCTCIPTSVGVDGKPITLGAVGGVATLPECRKRGYAGRVMCAVVEHMRRHGLTISALWPFSFPYYRKFGWDVACEHRVYRFAPDSLGPLPEAGDVSPVTRDDLAGLVEAYRRFREGPGHRQGIAFCTCRTEEQFAMTLRFGGVPPFAQGDKRPMRMLVCRNAGRIVGYAVYQRPTDEDRSLAVSELAADTPEVRLRIIAALAEREQPAQITFSAPDSDRFRAEIPDPRAVAVSLETGFSFRVVDPKAALETLTPPSDLSGTADFRVHDPTRPETPLYVRAEAAQGHVSAITQAAGSDAPLQIATDIPTFSQMYSGYLRPAQARLLGRLQTDEAGLRFAEALFPRWTAYRSSLEPG
jgi:predicted acetyltransferase